MIFRTIYFLFCLLLGSPAFATTQYYYLTPAGAGTNLRDTGAWAAVPETEANAMSASNFNDPKNWSKSDSADKIDPDDVVYPKGIWDSPNYNLTPVMGITLDFLENGEYDPVGGSKTIEPVFKNTKIFIRTNNVKIYDGRFGYKKNEKYRGPSYAIHAAPTSPNAQKIIGLEVKRNAFYGDYYSDSPSILFGFVCDSEVSGNYFEAFHSNWDNCKRHSRFFAMHSGSRNKIIDNHINGGYTGPIFWHKKDFNHDGTWDIPAIGSYAIDPDGNMEDNEIAGNYIERRCEEGITYDPGNDSKPISTVERDTVNSIKGNQITLKNNKWSNAGNKYSGFYMVSVDDENISFGRHALIQKHSNNTFTFSKNVSELFPGLNIGEYVIIALVFRHNWIHNNTFEGGAGYRGFESSILLEGVTLENMIEKNYMGEVDHGSGLTIMVRPLHSLPKSEGSITQTSGSTASSFNIIRNNTCARIVESVFNKKPHHPAETPWPFTNRNNAYYNNVLSSGLSLYSSNVFEINNVKGVVKIANNSEKLERDPTAHVKQYFANWNSRKQGISFDESLYLHPPKNVLVKNLD